MKKANTTVSKETIGSWVKFYKDVFNINVDTSALTIREDIRENDSSETHFILVAKGIKANQIYLKCLEHFKCEPIKGRDFDKDFCTYERAQSHCRIPDGTYGIVVQEAYVTLIERLLYELKTFRDSGKHLGQRWDIIVRSGNLFGQVSCAGSEKGYFRIALMEHCL